MRIIRRIFCLAAVMLSASIALATDIEGVQPAALDQPRVYICLRRDLKSPPLSTGKGAEQAINVTAFLDTGASGILLSKTTADALGIKLETAAGRNVVFHDVGVGGGDQFDVSEPLLVFMAASGKNGEPADASGYPMSFGPVRLQLGQSAGVMDMLTGGLDVVGMPAMKGEVAVLDPKPVDTFGDTMHAGVLEKNDSRIPKTPLHVLLSFGDFKRFTQLTPANAPGPTLADNPFIGPSPTNSPAGGKKEIPPIIVSFNGKQATGSFLLDTGAAASMISAHLAAKLGVAYVAGTEGTGAPKLDGPPDAEQFTFTVGGIGGQKKSAGFYLDSLTLPTRENQPLVYRKAPLLVSDIEVEDPATHQRITLDGVLGMNFFVASAMVQESAILPDINHLTAGPYDWIVFDEPAATLGLKLSKAFDKGESKIEITPGKKVKR